jgi:5-aminolevulinate synthase
MGFGGVGGNSAPHDALCDTVRSVAASFIFTTAMPPPVACAAAQSIRHLTGDEAVRRAHQLQVQKTRTALREAGIPTLPATTHIIAVPIGDPLLCRKASELLLERFAIYVQPINYPTVPRGTERLRITPTPYHHDGLIRDLAFALGEVWTRLRLPPLAGQQGVQTTCRPAGRDPEYAGAAEPGGSQLGRGIAAGAAG